MAQLTALQEDEFLYVQIAEKIERQIDAGLLNIGDKLLSVRSLSREQGISLSTAFQAYCLLETKGLIEARPKSGYYVRFSPSNKLPELKPSVLTYKDPREVSVDEMIDMLYENLSEESIMRFSVAAPALELLPHARLTKAMVAGIRRSSGSCLQYENIQGNIDLRKQLARHAMNWNGELLAEDIVITQGCMEALVICLKAVTQPGDTVAIECPTYFGIFNVMKSLGLQVLEIPSTTEGPDLEYLKEALDKVKIAACLFVPNFNNPTGSQMPDEKKKELVEMLAAQQIPLIEDDIYGELYFGKQRPLCCKSFDKEGLVLLCSSFSKSLAPGYRVGWCAPGRFRNTVTRLKLMHSVSTPTPTQAAIAYFLETGRYDIHLRKLRKALHTQSLRYIQAISEYFPPETQISRPQGGYVLWIALPPRVNAFELYQHAMEHKISIAPGQIFSTDAHFENYIRLSFGMPYSEEIEKSIRTLGKLVAKLRDKAMV